MIETFPAPPGAFIDRVHMPEFTCLCPKTGQPDFAKLTLWYKPNDRCLELKALKLYLWAYREQGMFHEAVTNKILDDFVAASAPLWMLLEGDFFRRGGISTRVYAQRGPVPDALTAALMVRGDW